MKSVATISPSLAPTMPAALARAAVSALRPVSEVKTLMPFLTRRWPTAAPIMPGAMTATTGFMETSIAVRRIDRVGELDQRRPVAVVHPAVAPEQLRRLLAGFFRGKAVFLVRGEHHHLRLAALL